MKPLTRGVAVALLQCLIVLSVTGKYAIDRQRLPRVWAKSAPFDPNLPLRGRYVALRLEVDAEHPGTYQETRLSVRGGRLVAQPGEGKVRLFHVEGRPWTLAEPVLFFIPENAADPSRRAPGEELWVEVSVPKSGPPRPVRLGVKTDGVITPLALE